MSKDLFTLLQLFLDQTADRKGMPQRGAVESFVIAYQSFMGMRKNVEESAQKLNQLKTQILPYLESCKKADNVFDNNMIVEMMDLLERQTFQDTLSEGGASATAWGSALCKNEGFLVIDSDHHIVFYNQQIFSIFPHLERHHYPVTEHALKGVSFFALLDENVNQHLYDSLWQKTAVSHREHILHNLQQETCEWEEKLASQNVLHYRSYQGSGGYNLILIQEKTTAQLGTHNLAYMAYYDQLTHTMNRQFFLDRLDYMIQDQQTRMPLALLVIDLDGFKDVNDMYGHDMGDWLLKQVAQRLKKNVRQGDLVSRFGGDEFVILFKNIAHHDSIRALGERLLEAMCEPYARGDITLNISGSMGIATYPNDCSSSHDLLKCADTAMYNIKQQGKKGIRFYSEIVIPKNNVMH